MQLNAQMYIAKSVIQYSGIFEIQRHLDPIGAWLKDILLHSYTKYLK